jgi:hypothetical protein
MVFGPVSITPKLYNDPITGERVTEKPPKPPATIAEISAGPVEAYDEFGRPLDRFGNPVPGVAPLPPLIGKDPAVAAAAAAAKPKPVPPAGLLAAAAAALLFLFR